MSIDDQILALLPEGQPGRTHADLLADITQASPDTTSADVARALSRLHTRDKALSHICHAQERWTRAADNSGVSHGPHRIEGPMSHQDDSEISRQPDLTELLAHRSGDRARWRTGRKVGRTIYTQRGPEPSDTDPLIGMLDTADLAQQAVNAVNFRRDPTPEQAADELARETQQHEGLDTALQVVSDWVREYREVGGINAGDLVWRLHQAGYALPEPTQHPEEP